MFWIGFICGVITGVVGIIVIACAVISGDIEHN